MKKIPLIIDTDPGIDDAAAIAIAVFSPNLDVKLISTVAGNVSIDKVTDNALKLISFWDKKIPVAKGASLPMLEYFVDASNIHGSSGMEGYDFPLPDRSLLLKEHAVEAMRRVILENPDPVTLMPIGPLTNIATLLCMYPEVKSNIKEIVLMGGATGRGNKGVYSEFNIATDPEAAAIVFNSGLKVVVVTLEMGLKALILPDARDKVKSFNKTGEMLFALFRKYRGGSFNIGLKMYDSCALAYILKPELFTIEHTFGDVELNGKYTRGATVFDLKGYLGKSPNIYVTTDIDSEAFVDWFLSGIKNCH